MFTHSRFLAFGLFFTLLGPAAMALAQPTVVTEQVQVGGDPAHREHIRNLVVEFYNGVFNRHEVARSSEVLADGYIQHNPNVPDGKAPFVNYFTGFFKDNPNARSRIVRSAVDGDLVYLHVHSTNGEGDRGRAIVDIFRVQGNKIVEHWDVIQQVPEHAANTNTMF